jgi:mannose-6-phosphate isomerase
MVLFSKPRFVERPWGYSFFKSYFPECPDTPIGEVWLLSGVKDMETPIFSVDLKENGTNIGDRIEEITGLNLPRFPVLIKLLKAKEWLSVQLHPEDNIAQNLAGEPWGKSEFWVVAGIDAGALLIDGLLKETEEVMLRKAIDIGDFKTELLKAVHFEKPAVGDIYEIEAGCVHALGPGVFVLEIQQSSDITYRLYDWGRDRPIHIAEAFTSLRWDRLTAKKHTVLHGLKNGLFDFQYQSSNTVSGFCVLLSPQMFEIDGIKCNPWETVIIPHDSTVTVRGNYFCLSLGDYWRTYNR